MRATDRTRSRPLAQLMWKKVSSEFRSVFGVDEKAHSGHMMSVEQSVLDGTSKWSAKIAITGLWAARARRFLNWSCAHSVPHAMSVIISMVPVPIHDTYLCCICLYILICTVRVIVVSVYPYTYTVMRVRTRFDSFCYCYYYYCHYT